MQQTFLELVSKTFYDTAQKDAKEVKLLLSSKFTSPSIKFEPNIEVHLPLPKKRGKGYQFNGVFFDKSNESKKDLWSLFLASVYHAAAHIAVSDYSIYKKWIIGKTPEICWKSIDFIEDDAASRFLSATQPEIWENIQHINEQLKNEGFKKDSKKEKSRKKFFAFKKNLLKQINEEMSKESLRCFDYAHSKKVVYWANFLYNHKELLPEKLPIYADSHGLEKILNATKKNFRIFPKGNFENKMQKLNLLFDEEEEQTEKFLRRSKNQLKGLSFDDVTIPLEDIHEFLVLKEKNHKLIKKIRSQIQMIVNNTEDPQLNFYGEIDMEKAIQAVASNSMMYAEVFNKDEDQRIEESWGILIDNSASLKLRFEPVKDFMLCLAEASDELTGAAGSWGLYSYDQKFSILKDFKNRYNQNVKARIGGLKGGGLSFTPDAIVLAGRIMLQSPGDIKHLFVFTDDFPTGLWNFDKKLYLAVKDVEKMGVDIIGIGLSQNIRNYFENAIWGEDMREITSEFIKQYRQISSYNL